MKSIPFMLNRTLPHDISEGDIIYFGEEGPSKITKIKSIRFIDMRTFQVIGLCKPVE